MNCSICQTPSQPGKYICADCHSMAFKENLKAYKRALQATKNESRVVQELLKFTSIAKEVPASVLIESLEETIKMKEAENNSLKEAIIREDADLQKRINAIRKAQMVKEENLKYIEKSEREFERERILFQERNTRKKIISLRKNVLTRILECIRLIDYGEIYPTQTGISFNSSKRSIEGIISEEDESIPSNELPDYYVEFFHGSLKFPCLTTKTIMNWLTRKRNPRETLLLANRLSTPPSTEDIDKLNATLGYIAYIVFNLERYLFVKLPCKIEYQGSTSRIWELAHLCKNNQSNSYPLFYNVDSTQMSLRALKRGLYLLNLNIIHLCFLHGIIIAKKNQHNFIHNLLSIRYHPYLGDLGNHEYASPADIDVTSSTNLQFKSVDQTTNSNSFVSFFNSNILSENYFIDKKMRVRPIEVHMKRRETFSSDASVHKLWPRGYLEGKLFSNYFQTLLQESMMK